MTCSAQTTRPLARERETERVGEAGGEEPGPVPGRGLGAAGNRGRGLAAQDQLERRKQQPGYDDRDRAETDGHRGLQQLHFEFVGDGRGIDLITQPSDLLLELTSRGCEVRLGRQLG